MKYIQKSTERGITKNAWLLSRHSFSFGSYENKKREKFGKLLVVNDDSVTPGRGFSMHSHKNMEILSLVLEGKLKHEDSEGNKFVLQENEIQLMSAGLGIMHSEMNASKDHPVHFLQIWIEPASLDLIPSYSQKSFNQEEIKNKLLLLASGSGNSGSLLIHQDAKVLIGELEKSNSQEYITKPERGIFCFLISGSCIINSELVQAGDSLEIYDEPVVNFDPKEKSKILIIDIPIGE